MLILYGSLRTRSYSKLLAFEFARILDLLGAEVRVFNPAGLPMKDEVSETHETVVELRYLSLWSEAQMWCCPEQHGTITGVFKNQIDWIPLSLGSVRPTQGRVLAVAQVIACPCTMCEDIDLRNSAAQMPSHLDISALVMLCGTTSIQHLP